MRAIDGIARLMGLDRERLSGGDIDSLHVNALYIAARLRKSRGDRRGTARRRYGGRCVVQVGGNYPRTRLTQTLPLGSTAWVEIGGDALRFSAG